MGLSPTKTQFIVDAGSVANARISGQNQDYVALPGSSSAIASRSQESLGSASKWRSCSMVVVTICCFAAVLCLSSTLVSYNFRFHAEEGLVENIASAGADSDYVTASRTSFHFQPPKNFMGDPCAPLFYKGYYHFFYQFNYVSVIWNTPSWGHTVSTDLVHWKYLGPVLDPDHWYDNFGTWTGSATILPDGSPIILYTGGRNNWGGEANQSTNMAVPADPSDPLLRNWKKVDNNPVFYNPEFVSSNHFRDPSTGWLEDDGLWRVIIGSRLLGTYLGFAMILESPDFLNWKVQDYPWLYAVPETGLWECVDLYPVFVEGKNMLNQSLLGAQHYKDSYKYVMKASVGDAWTDQYIIGSYSTEHHRFTPDHPDIKPIGRGGRLYDHGRFYASKTFYDTSTGRRILWGYVNESQSEVDRFMKGWACIQAIPRTIWLDGATNENVLVWPVEEVEALRGAKTSHLNVELQPTDVVKVTGGEGPQLDIVAVFEKPDVSSLDDVTPDSTDFDCRRQGADRRGIIGPFGLLVLSDEDLVERTAVFFYISLSKDGSWTTTACSDLTRSSLAPGLDKAGYGGDFTVLETEKELSVRILVDHSVVESFVQGGRLVMTLRSYPTIALGSNSHVFLFNNGTIPIKMKSMDVYKMSPVKITAI